MRIHGVSIDYVKKIPGPFENFSVDKLVEMKIHDGNRRDIETAAFGAIKSRSWLQGLSAFEQTGEEPRARERPPEVFTRGGNVGHDGFDTRAPERVQDTTSGLLFPQP